MPEADPQHGEHARIVRQLQGATALPTASASLGSVADLDMGNLDPRRWGATAMHSCSVCDRPLEQGGLQQVWISLRVATDVLPLLVSACSSACVAALPGGARDYVPSPHKGGRVDQPATD